MSSLVNLKPAVERKSGHSPISYDARELRSRLGYDVALMRQNGFDPSIIEEHQAFNDKLERVLGHAELYEYLSSLTPENVYLASGVRVLTLDAIKKEIQQLAPSSILLPYGYFPIASSIGGNVVCVHAPSNRFVWADHTSFGEEEISFEDRATKKWHYIPFTPDNIEKALVPLATGFQVFLNDLLADKLEEQLDGLD